MTQDDPTKFMGNELTSFIKLLDNECTLITALTVDSY